MQSDILESEDVTELAATAGQILMYVLGVSSFAGSAKNWTDRGAEGQKDDEDYAV